MILLFIFRVVEINTNRCLATDGIPFSQVQVARARRVALLASKAAQELFGTHNAVGKTITIERTPITVIGVLEPVNNALGAQDPNLRVFLPITTHKKIIEKDPQICSSSF